MLTKVFSSHRLAISILLSIISAERLVRKNTKEATKVCYLFMKKRISQILLQSMHVSLQTPTTLHSCMSIRKACIA